MEHDNDEKDIDLLALVEPQQPNDPAAQAFAQLRGEVALLRRAVEQLASERADIVLPDYSATLGKIALTLGEIGGDIERMATSPALEVTLESLAQRIDIAAQAARRVDHAAQIEARDRLDRATAELRQIIGTARTADEQRRRLAWVGGGALLAGMMLCSFLPGMIARSVPASWQWPERMAAHVIGAPMGEAGGRMMEGANPQQWHDIISAYRLWQNNEKAIARCAKVAGRKGKAAACSVMVKVEGR